jgi:hypothetical protein
MMLQFLALGMYVTAVAVTVLTVCRMLIISLRSGLLALDGAFPARSFVWAVAASIAVFIVTSTFANRDSSGWSGLFDPGVWGASIVLAAPFGVAATVLPVPSSRRSTGGVAWYWAGVLIVVVGPALMAIAAP